MEPLRMGVIGCASIARRRMLPAMVAAPETELVAVASRDGARAAEMARSFGCRPVAGYTELLDCDDIEAVYVPLPLALHATWVEAALRTGRHVLAEKPLAIGLRRTRELVALARRRGLVLLENVLFVHHQQHLDVRKLVADGAVGEVRSFAATFAVPELPANDIRYNAALAGGALWDVGIYPVRAALHVLGPDLQVVGAYEHIGPDRAVDTSGAALLRTSGGVAAQVTYGLEHYYTSRYVIGGSEGRLSLDMVFTPPADHRPRVRLERRSGTTEMELDCDDQVANTVRAFAAAVRNGAAAVAENTEDSLRQAGLLDEIRRRANGG